VRFVTYEAGRQRYVAHVATPKAPPVVTAELRADESISEAVECFAPHFASSTIWIIPGFIAVVLLGLASLYPLVILGAFGVGMYRHKRYYLAATNESLLLVQLTRRSGADPASLVRRFPLSTPVSKPYLFEIAGFAAPQALGSATTLVNHLAHTHLSVWFVGFKIDDVALWTDKGTARRLRRLNVPTTK
jgi:hypothetical protein